MELIIKAVKTFFYFFLGNQNVQAAPGEKSCCCLGCKGCVKALCHFLQQYSAECTWKCFHFSVLLLSNCKYSPLFHKSDSINNDLSINTFARNRHLILDISIHLSYNKMMWWECHPGVTQGQEGWAMSTLMKL